MATRGRKEWSHVAGLLSLAGIFLLLWGARPASGDGSILEEAKEKTETWANWVQDRVTEGLGLKHENERMAVENVKDAAGNAASKVSGAASDAAHSISGTAEETRDAAMNHHGDKKLNAVFKHKGGGSPHHVEECRLKAVLMVQSAKTDGKSPIPEEKLKAILKAESPISDEKLMAILKAAPVTEEKLMAILKEAESPHSKLEQSKIIAMLKAETAKAKMKDGANKAADKVEKAYEGSKDKVKETYATAKDTMTESGKANYEAAKEKASQATADMGAKMKQKTSAEL